jgi:hypothetical protein
VSLKKKEFKDLKDLLVSFGLYFVIAEVSLMNICNIDCQKKRLRSPTAKRSQQGTQAFVPFLLELVWLPLFRAGMKEFIYNSNKYMFGCHRIGYEIHLQFHRFSSHA